MSIYRVSVQGKSFEVTLLARQGTEMRFLIDGTEHSVSFAAVPRRGSTRSIGAQASEGPLVTEVVAPIPGIVSSVKVKPGDKVEVGQTLLVIEAMKMENPIQSPRAGVVKSVAVVQAAEVKAGALLVSFE